MDEEHHRLLSDMLTQQRQQTELLRQHLGRFKFSIRAILILTTLVALGLGYLGYRQQHDTTVRGMYPVSTVPPPAMPQPAVSFSVDSYEATN